MDSRWISPVITLFWLSTMTWLIESKVLPPLRRGDPPDYRSLYSDNPKDDAPVGWEMSLGGKPLGWAVNRFTRSLGGINSSDHITNLEGHIHFDRIPLAELSPAWMKDLWGFGDTNGDVPMDADSKLTINSLGRLNSFNSSLRLGGVREAIRIHGEVQASRLHIVVEAGQFREEFDTYLPSDALVASELSPQSQMTGLHVGQEWTVPVFSPLRPPNNPVEILQARVEESDPLVWGDHMTSVRKVVYRTDSGSAGSSTEEPHAKLWIADDGSVLRRKLTCWVRS